MPLTGLAPLDSSWQPARFFVINMTGDFRRIVWTIAHLPASACTTSAPGSKSPLGRGGGGGAARIGVLSSFPVVGVRLCASRTPLSQSASALLNVKVCNCGTEVHQNGASADTRLPSSI